MSAANLSRLYSYYVHIVVHSGRMRPVPGPSGRPFLWGGAHMIASTLEKAKVAHSRLASVGFLS